MPPAYRLQCANCGTVNPVEEASARERQKCAKCSNVLIKSNCLPQAVTQADFDTEVLGSSVPVIVYFWGPNCGVCASYELSVRKLAASLYGEAKVVSVNAEENKAVASRYGLKGVPTVMIFAGGRLASVNEGPQGERGLRERLAELSKV